MIAALCLVRLSFFLTTYENDPGLIIDPDTQSYLSISASLFERGKYERVAGQPEIHRPPGYAAFLAGNYALFGKDNLLAPVLVQHGLSVSMAIMIAYLAHGLGGPRASLVAETVFLLDFTSFYYLNEILSETLFTFFILFSLLLIRNSIDVPIGRHKWLLLAGLVATAAVFVRPVGMLLLYPVAILVGTTAIVQTRESSTSLKSMAIFILPWIILGGAWYLRNYDISGQLFFTNYEGEALFRRLRPVLAAANDIDINGANVLLTEMTRQGLKPFQVYFSVVFEHPWTFIKETSADLTRLLLSPGQWHLKFYFPNSFATQFPMEGLLLSGNFTQVIDQLFSRPVSYSIIIGLVMGHLLVLYTGGLFSLIRIFKCPTKDILFYGFLILYVAYFMAITAGFIGQPRFRVPFVPILAIMCGIGFGALPRRSQESK